MQESQTSGFDSVGSAARSATPTTPVTATEVSPCVGPRVSLQPARTTVAYPVRAFGSSAGGRLVRMTQTFDSERGGFVPETFIRGASVRGMRLLTYVVTDIIDVWQVPVPWWRTDAQGVGGGDGDACEQSADSADVHAQLAPMSRTVWRVAAIPVISFAGYHICGGVMDIAHDPDGTWSVVRVHD
ncbi:MAG: hypothetical protein EBU85_00805 [Actinobacteria bacterium]|nr:hypothetical protein [Actinomycetota bacterium]